jgi:AmmeMemoRadiSam system protein B
MVGGLAFAAELSIIPGNSTVRGRMTASTDTQFPRLRVVDPRLVVHGGRPALLLRDPLQLGEKTVVIPQQSAPVLALCDGTRDISALQASLMVRCGLRVMPAELERLVAALDEALLLDNDRFARARARALAEYREAPFRPLASVDQSYPADVDELRQMLDGYLEAVDDTSAPFTGRGLVSPHIDYTRGGPVYAAVWKRAAEVARATDLAVLLGTDHYGDAQFTLTRQHYATPFGVLPTAREVVDKLAQAIGEEEAFAGELFHRSEHSIELAAIWLHHVRQGKPCELVPILCGSFAHFVQGEAELQHAPAIGALVEMLSQVIGGRRVLLVAAADLAHVGPVFGGQPLDLVGRAQLQSADDELIAEMCAGDAEGFFAAIKRDGDRRNVCGLPPVYLALRALSPTQGERVAYDRCPADQNGTSWVSVCGVVLR